LRQIAEAVGCSWREYWLVDAKLNVLEIDAGIPECDPLVVCNPNNPFGHVEQNLAPKLSDRTGFIVCDEAYGEFAGESLAIEMIRQNRANLVVIRTFSKAFGAAGIRLGYLLGSSETLKSLKKFQLPYAVSCFAVEAGLRLWSLIDQLDRVTSDARRRREELERNLESIGFRIVRGYPNVTSFFSSLPPPPFEARILVSKLAERRCQVHLVAGGRVPDLIRFNAGSDKENRTVFLRLRELMAS
jgi:histidinol-phosphate aminotransferase